MPTAKTTKNSSDVCVRLSEVEKRRKEMASQNDGGMKHAER